MPVRPHLALATAFLVAIAACGPSIDLATDLEVAGLSSGFYDNGLKEGKHHLLPSVSFQLRNTGPHDAASLQLMVQFWKDGEPGEFDSRLLSGIDLGPGAESDPTLVRAERGYTLVDPDITTFFTHSQFTDFTVRFFARRSGQFVKIAEHQLERRILPQVRDSGRP